MVGRIREIVFDEGVDVDGIAIEAATKDYVDGKFDPKIECFEEGIWLDNTSGLPILSPWRAGVIAWDIDNKCMAVSSSYDGTWVQVGEETQDDGVNKTGTTLTNGTVVYIDGAQGNRPILLRANANDIDNAQKTIGLVTADAGILDNEEGPYTTSGVVRNLNTSMYVDGDVLWLDTTDGLYTKTKPANQYRHIMIGIVVKAHNTQGEIYVNIRDLTDQFALAGYYIIDPHGFTEYDNTYATPSATGLTFTLTKNSVNIPYFFKGEYKELTTTKSITLAATDGMHYIGYNPSTDALEDLGSTFPITASISTHVLTAAAHVYSGAINYWANERHSTKFPKRLWAYLHKYESTRYDSGLSPTVTSIDGNGSSADHARFSVTSGVIADEDITITVGAKTSTGTIKVWYRDTSLKWKNQDGIEGSGILNGGGRAYYNDPTLGGLVPISANNDYVLAHLFALNSGDLAIIMGQADYAGLAAARIAANRELLTLVTTGLPFTEFRAIATFIYKTNDTYGNNANAIIITGDNGEQFTDWRQSGINPIAGSAATNHNSLSGLQGGSAAEYYHLNSSNYNDIVAKIPTAVTEAGIHTLTNKYYNGGTASNNNKFKLPSDTYANLVTWAASYGVAGMQVYATDTKSMYVYDGSNLVAIGSGAGSGEKNYITNPSAASSTTGWGASSANITVARTTTAAQCPRENTTGTAIILTSSADEAYAYYRFTLDDVDLSKKLKAVLAFINADTSDAWRIEVWKNSASNYTGTYTELVLSTDSSGNSYLPVTTGEYKTTFDTDTTAWLELRIVHNGTNSDVLYISDVIVGPGSVVTGAVVGDWVSYTPANTGSWTANTTYAGKYRRVGNMMEVQVKAATSGAPSAGTALLFNLPSGVTIDTSVLINGTSQDSILGQAYMITGSGTRALPAIVRYNSTTSVKIRYIDDQSYGVNDAGDVTDTAPGTFGNGDYVTAKFTIPIADWAGSGTVNILNDTKQSPMKAGLIQAWPGATSTIPRGWLICDGSEKSITDYHELYASIGTTWNTAVNPLTGSAQSAPSAGNFRVPNLQGTFLRGVGDFSDNTKDTTLAGFQADQIQGHKHSDSGHYHNNTNKGSDSSAGQTSSNNRSVGGQNNSISLQDTGVGYAVISGPTDDGTNGTPRTGSETRPQNVGVYYIIKAYNDSWDTVGFGMANATSSGLVSTQAQTFAGVKTFSDDLNVAKNLVSGATRSGRLVANTSGGAVNLFQPAGYGQYLLTICDNANNSTRGLYYISGDVVTELHDSASVITIDYSGGYIRMNGGARVMAATWICLYGGF